MNQAAADVGRDANRNDAASRVHGRSVPPFPRGIVRAFLGTHAAVHLVPRILRTLWRVVQALRPGGMGIPSSSLFAFSEMDVRTRPWYRKIARDIAQRGRAGFVWDDGFGTPMGTRFYNNSISFALYRTLGDRGYTAASILLFMLGILSPAMLAGVPLIGIALCLLLLGSPLFLVSQIHLAKPEVLWWGFLAPLLFFAWSGQWLAAGIVFSIVAFGNFAAASLFGSALGLALIVFWPGAADAVMLVLGMMPGLVKTLLRVIPFIRAGLLESLAREQSDAAPAAGTGAASRIRLLFGRDMLFYGFFFFGALLLTVIPSEAPLRFLAYGALTWMIYFAGQKLFYLNDPQSFWLWHLGLLAAVVLLNPSIPGVLGVALLAYMHPAYCAMPLPETVSASYRGWSRWVAQGRQSRDLLGSFPYLDPIRAETVTDPLEQLFANVPPGTRILMESQSHSRDMAGYRTFVQLCDELLPGRDIELVPDEYVRIYSLDLFQQVISRFNAESGSAELLDVARTVGAFFALVYSPAFAATLSEAGYTEAARLRYDDLSERTRRLMQLPEGDLVLYQAPVEAGHVSPPVRHAVHRNRISWPAREGQAYTVRYTYHPQFEARQEGIAIPVRAVAAAPDSTTKFMQIEARAEGTLVLEFRGTWI